MKAKAFFLFIFFSFNFLKLSAQTQYPAPQELLPLLEKIPNLNLTLEKASKISSCEGVCCTENAIKTLLAELTKITTIRKNSPINTDNNKISLSNLNLSNVSQLNLATEASSLAKSTIKVLDGNPAMLSGKTVKAIDANPAMLGNNSVKVLDTNPAMLANKKSTNSLDSNPAMLSNSANKTSSNTTENKVENSSSNTNDIITEELEKLVQDETTFREKINNDWEALHRTYNNEIEKFIQQKKDIENNLQLDSKAKEKQLKNLKKNTANFYNEFMLNKANPLLKQQKEDVNNRYTYLEIIIKQNNYGINNNTLYPTINSAQNAILELIEALGTYSADCITAACVLNKEIN